MIIVRMFSFLANAIVVSIFSASIATTMALCSYFKVPFYNPDDLGNSLAHIQNNILPTYAGTCLIVFYATKNMSKRGFSLFNLGLYTVLIELTYYLYHRTIHHKWFYKKS